MIHLYIISLHFDTTSTETISRDKKQFYYMNNNKIILGYLVQYNSDLSISSNIQKETKKNK